MSLYARVVAGHVREIITIPDDLDLLAVYHPDLVADMVSAAAFPAVTEGWLYDGAAFSPPPSDTIPAAPAPTPITPREFRQRFTVEERAALTLAASQALSQGDPTLQVFLDDLSASQAVELDHPEILTGMAAIVTAGLISQARASEILAA